MKLATILQQNPSILQHKWYKKHQEVAKYAGKECFLYYLRVKVPIFACFSERRALETIIKEYKQDEKGNIIVWKLGITTKGATERVKTLNFPINCIVEIVHEEKINGIAGICLEKWLHEKNKKDRIRFQLIASGNSEIYKVNILNI